MPRIIEFPAGVLVFYPVLVRLTPARSKDSTPSKQQLVGGFKHFLFSIIYGIILPID